MSLMGLCGPGWALASNFDLSVGLTDCKCKYLVAVNAVVVVKHYYATHT